MTVSRYPVHQLVQDLMRDPQAACAFAADPEPVFAKYGLSEEERQLLRDGSPAALHALGMHPNLQMKYGRLLKASVPAQNPGPLASYLDRILER